MQTLKKEKANILNNKISILGEQKSRKRYFSFEAGSFLIFSELFSERVATLKPSSPSLALADEDHFASVVWLASLAFHSDLES